jgi:hypothetical protein
MALQCTAHINILVGILNTSVLSKAYTIIYGLFIGLCSFVDRHKFDANLDSDSTFHFDVDPDPDLDTDPDYTCWKIKVNFFIIFTECQFTLSFFLSISSVLSVS